MRRCVDAFYVQRYFKQNTPNKPSQLK